MNFLKNIVKSLKQNIKALSLAARDHRVPRAAKIVIAIVVAYALSPIDLIPDFIPIIGYFDDLILLPLGIALAIKMIPKQVWEDCRHRADAQQLLRKNSKNKIVIIVIVLIWLLAFVAIILKLFTI